MNKKVSRVLSIALALCLTLAIAIPAFAGGESVMKELWRNITVFVDGKEISNAILVDDTTYLPARSFSEAMGTQIGWDDATRRVYVDSVKVDPKAAEYLTEYFEIAPMTGTVSAETYTAALTAVFGEGTAAMTGATVADAVIATVNNCGLKQVPPTYSTEITTANTAGIVGVTEANAAYIATALDASLASGTWSFGAALDGETATQLLMNAVNIAGKGRNYLGNISDPDIAAKLRAAFGAFYDFHDLNNETIATLWKVGETIVDRKATTGFGLCSSDYDARFLNEYTVQYSHHSVDNAVQLVTVMNSLGIDAKVALEPKVSIYQWDGHLNAGMEYNLRFEFNTAEEKNDFYQATTRYVTRVDQEKTGNIIDPYWTPCYNSYSETTGFEHIYDNSITCGKYSLHPFSLPADVENVTAVVAEVAAEFNANAAEGTDQIVTEVKDLWCDQGFFRYLGGENQ